MTIVGGNDQISARTLDGKRNVGIEIADTASNAKAVLCLHIFSFAYELLSNLAALYGRAKSLSG